MDNGKNIKLIYNTEELDRQTAKEAYSLNSQVVNKLINKDKDINDTKDYIQILTKLISEYKKSGQNDEMLYCQDIKEKQLKTIQDLIEYKHKNKHFLETAIIIYITESEEKLNLLKDELINYGYKVSKLNNNSLCLEEKERIHLVCQNNLSNINPQIIKKAFNVLFVVNKQSNLIDYKYLNKKDILGINNYLNFTNVVNAMNPLTTFDVNVEISIIGKKNSEIPIISSTKERVFNIENNREYSINFLYCPECNCNQLI